MKRILSLCLVFALCVSMLAGVTTPASAASSGTCGENLTWTLDDNGTLTISGTGAMTNYSSSSAPWYVNRGSIKTVVIKDGVTSIGNWAFYSCDSLTSVTIGDSVTSIGDRAFYDCKRLTSVTIPDSVTSIGNSAFYSCNALTSVTIPDSVTSIGERVFTSCNRLTSVTIGDSVTSIGKSAFYGCYSLTSVTIGNSVTSIGDDAFYGCDKLTSVIIPDSVTSIGDRAFYSCNSLTSVTIGDSVTSIGEYAFYLCESLTSVTIGDSVTSIGEYAFSYCRALTSVTIPDSVTSIGDHAFLFCESLTSVTIPDSVTSIGEYAFYYCSSLTSVTIPDGVTSIGESAFYYCDSLTDVYYGGTEEDRDGISIGGSNSQLTNATWHYATAYDISISSVSGGTVSSNKQTAAEGKTVTLTATAKAGYEFVTFLLDGVAISGNTFVMPKAEVVVSAEFVPFEYTVTVGECTNGSVRVDKSVAKTNETVTVTTTPEAGYEISKILVNGTAIEGNTFTMPAGDVTVTATFVKKIYTITTEKTENGTVSTDKSGATFGEVVTVTATPSAGYALSKIKVNGTKISGNMFIMPKADVVVSAEFVADYTDYTITVGACENGSVSLDKNTANNGETVTVTATPDAGYELSKILVNGKEISGNTFTTPAGDVTVTATFVKKVYSITIEPSEQGSVATDRSGATFGEVVTVTVTPNAGYALSKIKVNGTKISGNMFIMPKAEVVVSAEFVALEYTVTVGEVANGSVSVNKSVAKTDETIMVTATPDAGYELSKILVNGTAISGNTFTMPAGDVTVTATFVKKEYSITAIQPEEGIVMLDKSNATFGEIITVTTVPMIGYTVAKIKVNGVAIVGNAFVMPKSDVTVTVEFVLIPEVTLSTINGAQIRTTGAQGLRFISSIDKTSLDFERVVEYGTVLIPTADITDISELQIGAILNGHAVAKVKANYMYNETDDTITFTAVLTNVAEKNYAREYTARAYAIMDDGSIVYADTGASRSIYAVAKRGLENPNESDANKEIFQAIVDTVENA